MTRQSRSALLRDTLEITGFLAMVAGGVMTVFMILALPSLLTSPADHRVAQHMHPVVIASR
ncbi:hypothetical protein HLH33_17700 [Gluconacetobacter diazotrophicus]|uniref:Uncharacterized protein n=1 Tax=Gluconacetobacter diazotrophicus TaxID=33996 RepID=A0A7W4I8E8_GLUDI|nr:hypothetical protein [Gluconacetobacter diazotrophicus]MBB2158107.1 hypothetical protein [Gluconacetobacter diazotrophicus]